MKKILIIIALTVNILLFSQSSQKQTIPYIPKVSSPEVYNLELYGNYPVDPSTGVPKIDIPLYTIKSGSLSLPISLSYHASGIKLNQEASSVGLGWVLNAGGMIFRNLQDIPDDKPNGFLTGGNSIPVYNDINQLSSSSTLLGTIGNNSTIKRYYNFNEYEEGSGNSSFHQDKIPDQFNISTNVGLSGAFYINNEGKVVSAEFDPQKIDAVFGIGSIIVKDEKGTIYRFGKSLENKDNWETVWDTKMRSETDGNTSYDAQPSLYTSSWYLSEIISADKKDTINIEYVKYRSKTYRTFSSENKIRMIDNVGGVPTGSKQYLETEVDVLVMDKLKYNDGYVEFIRNEDRQDVYPLNNRPPRISGLIVYNKQNKLINKIIFDNNDYFERPKITDVNYWFMDFYKKSLKLNSVKFYDQQNDLINQFKFGYDYSSPLPARESTYGIDYWGYYNGKNNNTTLLPTVLFDNALFENLFSPDALIKGTLTNENRQANFNYMKSGVLNKITYPTGGSTTYEYEPNYFLTKQQELGLGVFQAGASAYALKSSSGCTDESGLIASPHTIKEYQITQQPLGTVNFAIMLSGHYSLGQPLTATITVDGETKTVTHGPTGSNNIKTESMTFFIHQGSHIKIDLDTKNATGPSSGSPCNSPFISVSGTYKYYAPVPPESIQPTQAGGLRIKNIINTDSNNTVLSKKSYDYGSKKVNNIGIGKILTNPFDFDNFYNRKTRVIMGNITHVRLMNIISSNPMVEISHSNGSPVFYDKVTEYIVDNEQENNKLGKIEYYYKEKDVDKIYTTNIFIPYPRYIYPEWKKTNLIETISYKKEGTNYIPVKKEENFYEKFIENRIRTVNVFEQDNESNVGIINGGNYEQNPERFYYFNDYVSIGRVALTSKKITDYMYGSQTDSLTTKISYLYSNPQHYQLTKEIITSADNILIEKDYAYAHEKANQKLINANMVGVPLETAVKKNDKTISKSEIKYDNPLNLFPSSVLSTDLQNNQYTEVTYDKYDTKGNLQQYTTKAGVPVTIIWGYNETQPIAKIEGATYDQVSGLISAIISASDSDAQALSNNDETSLLSVLNTFRNSLPNYLITTYTYDPLIGVRSITPSSGIRENYLYDSAGRLQKVVDVNGQVVKEMKYNYKN
ncbi:hypothetical protein EU348_07265 [Chryseobacterium indologenes]|uniref:YD repeat-containing protein n=1 Tax=Chryseobacterium indologenes TaxID=253 RepID=A0A411DL08_CHRID|nr:hypothetical protein EU348_07265 [Chryseobacterium indologenes]